LAASATTISAGAAADDAPAASTGALRFYVDFAGFRGQQDRTFQEIYLMLYCDQFQYSTLSETTTASFEVELFLQNTTTQQLIKHKWITDAAVAADSADLKALAIYDVWAGELFPGNYSCQITVRDLNGSQSGNAKFDLEVPEFHSVGISASEIEFVSHAEEGATRDHFVKGNRTVIPNPARRFGALNSVLYFYYEIYNLPESLGQSVKAAYTIRQLDGTPVKTLPAMEVRRPIATANQPASGLWQAGVLHGFDVSRVPSGIYQLEIALQNSAGGPLLTRARNFEIIQLDYVSSPPELEAESADVAAAILNHLASPNEVKVFEQLNASAKAQYLIRFWRERDPTPGTLRNEFLEQIQQRVLFCNQNFSWGKTKGIETDRGRVLIQNGAPDDIERYASEAETAPYEIWIYRQDRSYEFVFADLRSDGRYALLHSNKEDEVHNVYWQELVKRL
jgi:GWxTD domain-containing protein